MMPSASMPTLKKTSPLSLLLSCDFATQVQDDKNHTIAD